MNIYNYKVLTVEVSDDPFYQMGSSDNKFRYSKHYFAIFEHDQHP